MREIPHLPCLMRVKKKKGSGSKKSQHTIQVNTREDYFKWLDKGFEPDQVLPGTI